ncbi:hypothetical protein [Pandoraea soli]|uniref:Uncharacterized protein n=1 Tax=Pandoraea soli TaxID=2508293 RepID=A0ABY6W0R5_9BURK|nr:hypothetical protein [Pandoraea soli]VVD85803.1 hypothetical protein PSO31014_01342 [Pandoraea soli]
MEKIILNIITVLIGIYWIGEKIRRNQKIDEFLSAIEGHYSTLSLRLEDATILSGLRFLRRIYGWISAFSLIFAFMLQRFLPPDSSRFLLSFWLFMLTFMGWFSIKWVIDHRKTVGEFLSKGNALMILGPLLMGFCDIVLHTKFTPILFSPFQHAAKILHISTEGISNPLAIGGVISFMFLSFFCIYYSIAWIAAAPVFLVSVFVVMLPIRFARALAKIDPSNKFLWFTVVVMIVVNIWSQL